MAVGVGEGELKSASVPPARNLQGVIAGVRSANNAVNRVIALVRAEQVSAHVAAGNVEINCRLAFYLMSIQKKSRFLNTSFLRVADITGDDFARQERILGGRKRMKLFAVKLLRERSPLAAHVGHGQEGVASHFVLDIQVILLDVWPLGLGRNGSQLGVATAERKQLG